MCDYSLHEVRPTCQGGDKLVSTQFWNTTSTDFQSANLVRVLLPGTEIAFDSDSSAGDRDFLLIFSRKISHIPDRVGPFPADQLDNPARTRSIEFPGARSCC